MRTVKEVKTIRVDYLCTECGAGYLRSTGAVLYCDPPKYPHKCNNCGYEETLDRNYPCLEYEYV